MIRKGNLEILIISVSACYRASGLFESCNSLEDHFHRVIILLERACLHNRIGRK